MNSLTPTANERIRTCSDSHCKRCLVCSQTIFEERRADKWKRKALPGLSELYQALFLLQIKQRIAAVK